MLTRILQKKGGKTIPRVPLISTELIVTKRTEGISNQICCKKHVFYSQSTLKYLLLCVPRLLRYGTSLYIFDKGQL